MLEAAADTIRPSVLAKEIELDVRTTKCVVVGDAARLQQVVWNLLSNAVKFTPKGGRIELSLEQRGDEASIVVKDTGCGMSKDFLPYAFDRFRQADASSTRREGGLGLGLAIVRHFVELHGGAVRAESEGGRGSTFIVTIPVHASELAETESAKPAQRGRLAGLRVLVCDDDEDARTIAAEALTAEGAIVAVTSGASEALEQVRDFHPDLLVSDIAMPHTDGYTLLREIRRLPAGNIPAVALTAHVQARDLQLAYAAGYQQHVAKPANPDALVDAVERVARQRHESASGGEVV